MWSFSVRHRSQVLLPGLYEGAFDRISHFISGVGPSFCSQMYVDRVVLYLLLADLKDAVWL